MKTSRKLLLSAVVVIVVTIGMVVYYVATNLDSLVKAAIEKYGSQATQTAVRVESVAIQLTDGAGTLRGVTVANPPGFATTLAFSLGEIHTRIDPRSVTKDTIVIDEVTIRAPRVFYEMNAEHHGNLNLLKDNLGTGASAKHKNADKQVEGKPIKLHIRHLLMKEATLEAKIVPLNNKQLNLQLPLLELSNLRGTPAEISKQVLSQLIDQAREAVKKSGIDDEVQKLKAGVAQKVDEEKAKLKEKAAVTIDAEKQKAQEQLKKLLGR
jgi:hypothetical protein